MVRAHAAARTTGCRLIVGCRLDLAEGWSLLVYPADREAYGRLCRLLTIGRSRERAPNGGCHLTTADVAEWSEGLLAVLPADRPDDTLTERLRRLKAIFGRDLSCGLSRRFGVNDHLRLEGIAARPGRPGADRGAGRRALPHA